MPVSADFSIDYVNKRIYHLGASTTIYNVNDLYSWLQSIMDDTGQMDDAVPMSAQTPTEYTMINGWFIDDESIKYLKGGAIQTSGWGSGVVRHLHLDATKSSGTATSGTTTTMVDTAKDFVDLGVEVGDILYNTSDVEQMVITSITTTTNPNDTLNFGAATTMNGKNYSVNTYLSPVASDIGKLITGATSGDTAVLLSFAVNESGKWEWYVRPTDPATDLFEDVSEEYEILLGTGKGVSYKAAPTGETTYTNIYTLGTIETDPAPLMYVKRGDSEVPLGYQFVNDTVQGQPWWVPGHIDILIKTKDADVAKNDGIVTIFARQAGDNYDHFDIDLTAGGRNAVPLATSPDLNNVTGESVMLFDTQTAAFNIGATVTGGTSNARAEIIAVDDWGTTGLLTLSNVIGTFQDAEALTDDGAVPGGAAVNGTIGAAAMNITEDVVVVLTEVLTGQSSGATGTVRGLENGADLPAGEAWIVLSIPVDLFALGETLDGSVGGVGNAGVPIADSVTYVSGFTDIDIWFVNFKLYFEGLTTPFQVGETVTGATSGAEGIVVAVDTGAAGTLTLGNRNNVWFQDTEQLNGSLSGSGDAGRIANGTGWPTSGTKKAFDQGALKNYKVIIRCKTRPLAEVYEYLKFITREGSAYQLSRTTDEALIQYTLEDYNGGSPLFDSTQLGAVNSLDVVADVTYLQAAVEVGDAVYFGGLDTFGKLKIFLSTAGVSVHTNIWEYWNGSTWATLPDIGQNGIVGDAEHLHFRVLGKAYITYTQPTDWALTTIDGVEAYFIRARVSAYTSQTTPPVGDYCQLYGKQGSVDGAVYSEAHFGYVAVKPSPFGTFAGGRYFGARSVWVEDMATADIQNYQLIDADDVQQVPPNYQSLVVTSLLAGDTVAIFRTLAGVIDKAIYTMTAQATDSPTIIVDAAIATDTPAEGFVRVVDDSTGTEQRYQYDSWLGSTFTLNTTAHPTGTDRAYTTSDTAYVPFIDVVATGTSETVTVIYDDVEGDRNIVARVRRYNGAGDSILPFQTTGIFGETGYSVATIRTEDTIVN